MSDTRALSVAIVGLGPRGLSVLERLLIRLQRTPLQRPVVVWAIDPVEHGPGRVWRSDQPRWLNMNATASEVSIQSPDSYLTGLGFTRPHSLSTWTESGAFPRPGFDPVEYPPRRVYGEYLGHVFGRLCAGAPAGVRVVPVLGEVTALERGEGGTWLTVEPRTRRLPVDKVVLATGHSPLEPTEDQRVMLRHADRYRRCRYLAEDMVADMPLEAIRAGEVVAVRGLGLTFYDLVRSFSVGRGGHFVRDGVGSLRYVASGQEPHVVAGSRGGLPFRARPRMTEPPETAPRPVVLTDATIARLRAEATARRGSPKLDFAGEVEPLIQAEVEHAYFRCAARLRGGDEAAERFGADFLAALERHGPAGARRVVVQHRLDDEPGVDLNALARPFEEQRFSNPSTFRSRLLEILRADVDESRRGTHHSPLKSGLEVLRQIRPVLPAVVDFGGLLPSSHEDFLGRFEPLSYVLSAGPEDADVEQLIALIEGGIVEVVGPGARFTADEGAECFAVESPHVAGSRRTAPVMIEARAPGGDIARTASPLIRQLLADGMISQYVNADPITGDTFRTGGLAVTTEPFQVIDGQGHADPDIYAIGVATDKTRWFTQVGTGRPDQDSPFSRDADAIAGDILQVGRLRFDAAVRS